VDRSDAEASKLVASDGARLSRRALLARAGGAALTAAIAQATLARRADAGIRWCQVDPLIRVGGKQARLYLASTEEMLAKATSPVSVLFMVPYGVSYEVLESDNGFGFGYTVSWAVNGGMQVGQYVPVQVGLVCPAWNSSIPVLVDWVPSDAGAGTRTVEGRSNTWISFDARM
jgi:hypothetical protein